jgi:hypothetical protein
LLTSAGSRFPFRFRTCICEEFPAKGNVTTESVTVERTGVAMDAFSANHEERTMKWESPLKAEDTSSSPTSPRRLARLFTPGLAWLPAGLRTCRHGHLRMAFLLTHLPGFGRKPVVFGCSFLLTAAGQFRLYTGFPLTFPWERHQQATHKIG